jgi:hypothetical protein
MGCNSRDIEMWQEPDRGRDPYKKKVSVPSKNKDTPDGVFERTVVRSLPGTFTMTQALFMQRKRDQQVA